MKKCSKCSKIKEDVDFHKILKAKDGLAGYCKECKKEYDKEYRKSHKVQSLYKSKAYRDRKNEYQKYITYTKPEHRLCIQARARAKKNNLPFNITSEDIIIPEYCPILGLKLEASRNIVRFSGSFKPNSPSLDKIEPSKGYVKGNIMVISMKANAMKNNASLKELELFCKNYLKLIEEMKKNKTYNSCADS